MNSWAHSNDPLDRTWNVRSIRSIIEASSKCGVSRLKLGDLEIRFFDPAKPAESPKSNDFQEFAEPTAQESAPTDGQGLSPRVKELVEQFAEEQQLLDDPLAFETLQADLQMD